MVLFLRKTTRVSKKTREHYARTSHNNQIDTKLGKNRNLRSVPCFKFNKKGRCQEGQDHIYKDMLLKHACQTCHQISGKFLDHARMNCPRNVHNNHSHSKNV